MSDQCKHGPTFVCSNCSGEIPQSSTMSKGTAELIAWLQERHDNCIRIAAQKTGDDRAGWLDDALYFELTLSALGLANRKYLADDDQPHDAATCERMLSATPAWMLDVAGEIDTLYNCCAAGNKWPDRSEVVELLLAAYKDAQ